MIETIRLKLSYKNATKLAMDRNNSSKKGGYKMVSSGYSGGFCACCFTSVSLLTTRSGRYSLICA